MREVIFILKCFRVGTLNHLSPNTNVLVQQSFPTSFGKDCFKTLFQFTNCVLSVEEGLMLNHFYLFLL